jgi:hypothetical protein
MTTAASLRDRLVQTLDAARERESVLIARCDDAPAPVADQWTAKDNVAHLSAWREHAALTLDAMRLDQPLPELPYPADLDARNQVIFDAHQNDPADTVIAWAARTYTQLIEALRACSDEDLRRERPADAGPLWRIVPGNGHDHVAQHLTYWYAEHDNPAAADDAALWAHSLEVELFPDPADRAVADYNLACFYARTGRGDEALPLLSTALKGRPDLLRWASDDPDLDSLRGNAELQQLLAL